MHLFIDIGNTAIKWRARGDGRVLAGGGPHHRDWREQLLALSEGLPDKPARVVIASVAGRQTDELLAGLCREILQVAPEFYYSPARDAGVTSCYQAPQRLGVDRWLAIVEAWHTTGAAIVIDCGSAMTIDAVNRDGQHCGGYIVPGLRMLETSLVSGTGAIRLDPASSPGLAPGTSTEECVRNGILRMSVAFIADAVVALHEAVQDTCPIIITGGDAAMLASLLAFPVQVVPDLVLDGLERVTAQHQ